MLDGGKGREEAGPDVERNGFRCLIAVCGGDDGTDSEGDKETKEKERRTALPIDRLR